jgi:hypothetical protein
MNVTSTLAGSITISGLTVLQAPRPIDPQRGPRNIVFDANFCIIEGSQTATMALLRYFASNKMASEILNMSDKPFQKAFVVANVRHLSFLLTCLSILKTRLQIASATPNSISNFVSDFEPSDYAFVGDIHQVRHTSFPPL